MPKSKTFFEQIPIETVKKIAKLDPAPNEQTANDNVIVEMPAKKNEPYSIKVSRREDEAV